MHKIDILAYFLWVVVLHLLAEIKLYRLGNGISFLSNISFFHFIISDDILSVTLMKTEIIMELFMDQYFLQYQCSLDLNIHSVLPLHKRLFHEFLPKYQLYYLVKFDNFQIAVTCLMK